VLRAEYIKDRLDMIEPELMRRIIASGVGASENLVGTSKDDESDALDRRVEFKVIKANCGQTIVPEQYNVY
jgi:outer membrane protein OmpA-like peptidoglycan-associated protein